LEEKRSPSYPHHVPIRIVIAEDQYLVREGLRRLLETPEDFEVASACSDLDSLLAAVEAEQPDVVVTDIRMPPGNTDEGIQAATRLRETNPEVGVVVLSQYAVPTYVLALLEGGSEGRAYLPKERGRGGWLGLRPEGRGGFGGGEREERGVAAQRADSA
jgi:DNA-binding NarL/FixJ family response regulator